MALAHGYGLNQNSSLFNISINNQARLSLIFIAIAWYISFSQVVSLIFQSAITEAANFHMILCAMGIMLASIQNYRRMPRSSISTSKFGVISSLAILIAYSYLQTKGINNNFLVVLLIPFIFIFCMGIKNTKPVIFPLSLTLLLYPFGNTLVELTNSIISKGIISLFTISKYAEGVNILQEISTLSRNTWCEMYSSMIVGTILFSYFVSNRTVVRVYSTICAAVLPIITQILGAYIFMKYIFPRSNYSTESINSVCTALNLISIIAILFFIVFLKRKYKNIYRFEDIDWHDSVNFLNTNWLFSTLILSSLLILLPIIGKNIYLDKIKYETFATKIENSNLDNQNHNPNNIFLETPNNSIYFQSSIKIGSNIAQLYTIYGNKINDLKKLFPNGTKFSKPSKHYIETSTNLKKIPINIINIEINDDKYIAAFNYKAQNKFTTSKTFARIYNLSRFLLNRVELSATSIFLVQHTNNTDIPNIINDIESGINNSIELFKKMEIVT